MFAQYYNFVLAEQMLYYFLSKYKQAELTKSVYTVLQQWFSFFKVGKNESQVDFLNSFLWAYFKNILSQKLQYKIVNEFDFNQDFLHNSQVVNYMLWIHWPMNVFSHCYQVS